MRGGLPWLRSGPLYRVSDDALILLDAFLAEHPYRRIDLYGSVMVSRDAAHEELHRAFDFPDWCGNNWDAFNDCFGHFVHDNDGALLAVVWRDVPAAAAAAPVTTAEVGWALLQCAFGEMPSLGPGATWSITLDVFALGQGPDFDGPEEVDV